MSLKKEILAGLRAWLLSDKGMGKEMIPPSAKEVAYSVDWVRSVPFIALHLMCFGDFYSGLESCCSCRVYMPVFCANVFHYWFLSSVFFTSNLQSKPFHATASGFGRDLLCSKRSFMVGSASSSTSQVFRRSRRSAFPPTNMAFFGVHIGWITDKRNFPTRMSLVPDLARFRELRFLDQFDLLVPASMGVGLYFLGEFLSSNYPALGTNGWQMLIWGFFVSTILLLHGSCMINSAAHLMGKQNYETGDQSRNSLILSLFTLGEGWHNNHHYYPATARQGFFWWELDVTFLPS